MFLVVAVLILGVVVWQQRGPDGSAVDDGTVPAMSNGPDEHTAGVSAALADLQDAWHDRDRDAFIAAAGDTSAAKSWGAQTYDNLDELGVRSIDVRVADGQEPAALRQDGTFEASIDVSWVPGAESGLSQRSTDAVGVDLRVRPIEDGYGIESASPSGDPMPLWLAGALDVTRQGDRVIARVDGGAPEPQLQQLMIRAMADVRRVYGEPRDPAFVVIPQNSSQSTDIIGGSPQRLSQLAAMTTTLDGSASSSAPDAVVLNPDVYTPMDARAAQIVLTHEVTHDVTDATTAVAPLWVSEGYADYVALSRDRLEPTRSASQILKRVRRQGVPKQLPDDDRFTSASPRLGATYESAWMFFRMLGEIYDDETITGFYREVLGGTSVDVAARSAFGVELGQLTAQWRAYLRDWARTAPAA